MTRLRTVLVGAGKIGQGYASDPAMAQYYEFATHAQVLSVHPDFSWGAVIDASENAAEAAARAYGISVVGTSVAACRDYAPEVAVLATPTGERRATVAALPSLRAVLVEKPLGTTHAEARAFVADCDERGIAVQVNLWRRADDGFRELAATLQDTIGRVQCGFGVYGNGLHNNATHMVDFVRMLVGEIVEVQATSESEDARGPVPRDIHVAFSLRTASGATVAFGPLDFRLYRENGLDLWGERGRLAVFQEGLDIRLGTRVPNRAMSGEYEVASDAAPRIAPTVGRAFYRMYDNLCAAIRTGAPLVSGAESAMATTRVIDAIVQSAAHRGSRVRVA